MLQKASTQIFSTREYKIKCVKINIILLQIKRQQNKYQSFNIIVFYFYIEIFTIYMRCYTLQPIECNN